MIITLLNNRLKPAVGDSERLSRELALLDSLPVRECIKVGLVYIGPGQLQQSEILANTTDSCSQQYMDFLSSLGDKVELQTHCGFLGGLSARGDGAHSVYYQDAQVELMYHVATHMPTSRSDPQQVGKKKHVANDYVHVVWNESGVLYDPYTISGHFNHVHIVIAPLSKLHQGSHDTGLRSYASQLYSVRVFSKPDVPAFGPLQDGMLVSGATLGPLTRLTSISSSRAVR